MTTPTTPTTPTTTPGTTDTTDTTSGTPRRSKRRRVWVLAGALVVVAAVALALFQPWRLVVDVTVNEANPIVAPITTASSVAPSTSPAPSTPAAPAPVAPTPSTPDTTAPATAPTAPAVPQSGSFRSVAHSTSGTATVGTTADGTSVVFIEDLETDNGPDVRVYLSTVPADGDAATFAREGLHLGELKGNKGDQSYAIPAGTDLSGYRSVVIWCERFSVAFGVAPIPTPA